MKKYWLLPQRGSYLTFEPPKGEVFGSSMTDAVPVYALGEDEVVLSKEELERAFYKIIEDRTNTMDKAGIPYNAVIYSSERMRDLQALIKILFKSKGSK
jgi:hypothetical protein